MERNELNQVRQIIERNTSKVSLRDLERKGFRKVKVLRSSDIDNMIQRAVADALAQGEGDRERLVEQSRQKLQEQMAEARAQAAAAKEADELIARLQDHSSELEARLQEMQARLGAAESRAGQGAEAQIAVEAAERRLRELDRARQQAEERLQDKAQRVDALARRLEEAEARALAADSRATTAEKRMAEASAMQVERDELKLRVRQLETEKRLIEELEVGRLRKHIEALEADLLAARSQAHAAEGGGGEDMRRILREALSELNLQAPAAAGGQSPELSQHLERIQAALAAMGGKSVAIGLDEGTAKTAVKLALDDLFDRGGGEMTTNITSLNVKETTAKGVGSSLDKLKNLRKKG